MKNIAISRCPGISDKQTPLSFTMHLYNFIILTITVIIINPTLHKLHLFCISDVIVEVRYVFGKIITLVSVQILTMAAEANEENPKITVGRA